MSRGSEHVHRLASLPALRHLRRSLNSSPLIPGFVRQVIGGYAWSSGDYRVVGTDETARVQIEQLNGWHSDRVAKRHAALWSDPEAQSGRPDVQNLRSALAMANGSTVLEVGCGPAHNASYVSNRCFIGVDSSLAQLRVANTGAHLIAGDCTRLPVLNRGVDIVIDGGTLIHIPRWESALAEECRVAHNALILHTITVTDTAPTTFLTKRAFGYPVAELVFSRRDIEEALSNHGFAVVHTWPGIDYNLNDVIGIATVSETWLCEPTLTSHQAV